MFIFSVQEKNSASVCVCVCVCVWVQLGFMHRTCSTGMCGLCKHTFHTCSRYYRPSSAGRWPAHTVAFLGFWRALDPHWPCPSLAVALVLQPPWQQSLVIRCVTTHQVPLCCGWLNRQCLRRLDPQPSTAQRNLKQRHPGTRKTSVATGRSFGNSCRQAKKFSNNKVCA